MFFGWVGRKSSLAYAWVFSGCLVDRYHLLQSLLARMLAIVGVFLGRSSTLSCQAVSGVPRALVRLRAKEANAIVPMPKLTS